MENTPSLIGPRLTDADFFQKIDITRPGLEGIPAAVQAGDFATARRLFAAEVRRTLQPERFLTIRREFKASNFMHEGETTEQAAERILQGELISCGTPHRFEGKVDWFANPTYNQYKEWTWQLSRHPEWGILAKRYRETGDERFAAGFVRFFDSWVKQALVPENESGEATLCWRTIEAGIRMGGVWQWALHTFIHSPHFTDDVLIDWYKSVWEHGWRLRNFHRTGNWLIMEMNGLAQIGIIYPQFKDSPAWKAYAFDLLVKELTAQVYPDGWQVELSTDYHQVDIINYQWLIDVCKAYAEPIPAAFRESLERMHAVNVLAMMPDGLLPDVNDGQWFEVASLMQSAAEDYPERPEFRWAFTRGKEGQPPKQNSVLFPYAGYAVMRTGWQPDAVWAFFDGGHFGYGHQHEDKLNLIIHAYGRRLLTEAGNYAYDTSEMRAYVLSTRSHNTVRVDGQDQNRRINYRRDKFDVTQPSQVAWLSTPAFDTAEAIYDEGYGPQADCSVTHRRKVIFLKETGEKFQPCFIVIDRLTSAAEETHRYQWLWHLNGDEAQCTGLAVSSVDTAQPNLTVLPAVQTGLDVKIIQGQESPEWQGWKSIKHHQQGEFAPTPTAIYEWETGSARLVTLLYPTRPNQDFPIQSISASANLEDQAITLVFKDGSQLTLNELDFESQRD